jgi:hypothetical protein
VELVLGKWVGKLKIGLRIARGVRNFLKGMELPTKTVEGDKGKEPGGGLVFCRRGWRVESLEKRVPAKE